MIFLRNTGEIVVVTEDSMTDQLNAVHRSPTGTFTAGSYLAYTGYSVGNDLPDGTTATRRFLHQTYISVPVELRRRGISYLLTYAGAVLAAEQGYADVGTNMPNKHSQYLATKLSFGTKSPEIQYKSATAIRSGSLTGLTQHGWRVTGGRLSSRVASTHTSTTTTTTTTTASSSAAAAAASAASSATSVTTPLLNNNASSNSSGCCFLTTACCRWRGLPDDCEELTQLRHYRDSYLQNSDAGISAVERYYQIAPAIAAAIDRDENAQAIYEWIYDVIQRCLAAIRLQDYNSVFEQYKQMVLELEDWYSDLKVKETMPR
ncbi:MAG TPA: CFI-box-CTERM domain-containing protein [Pyrinomonadaceae bacterium]|nr:CFI-box-CTERM domain-containing protein [Pyrinomonadaceae bacterium]